MAVGLPGCGKTTWFQHHGVNAISSDEIRRLLIDDSNNQTIQREVFRVLRSLVRRRLEMNRPETYVDATNLTPGERRPYIVLGALYGASVEALFFDVPLDVCKMRNRSRSRVVPTDVMDMLAARLTPPGIAEGFTRVTRIQEPSAGETA